MVALTNESQTVLSIPKTIIFNAAMTVPKFFPVLYISSIHMLCTVENKYLDNWGGQRESLKYS